MSVIGINICLVTAYIMSVVLVGCWGMPTSGTCASPVDLVTRRIVGPATVHLPRQARHLQVKVMPERTVRAGVVVVRLWPVDVDQLKCTAVTDDSHLCYNYLEIRWGSTDGQGSDHSFNGKTSELELQHYFRRTDGERVSTLLAVAVLARPNRHHHRHTRRSMTELVQLLENERTSMNLTVGDLLPPEGQAYYQYSGTVPGLCRERTEWLVYDGEIDTPRQLLLSLRSRWAQQGTRAHFSTVKLTSDILYSDKSVVPEVARIRSRAVDDHTQPPQESEVSPSTAATTTAADILNGMTTAAVQPSVQASETRASSRQTEAPQDSRQAIEANVDTQQLLEALKNVSGSGDQTDMESPSDKETGARAGEETRPAVTLIPSNEEVLPVGETRVHSGEGTPHVTKSAVTREDVETVSQATGANPDMEAPQDEGKTKATPKAGGLPDEAKGAQSEEDVSPVEDAEAASDAGGLTDAEDQLGASADAEALSDAELMDDLALSDAEATDAIADDLALSDAEVTDAIADDLALSDAEVTDAIADAEATEGIPDDSAASYAEVTEVIPDAEVLPGAEAHVGAILGSDVLPEADSTTSAPAGTSVTVTVSPAVSEATTVHTQPLASTTPGGATSVEPITTTEHLPPTTTEEASSGPLCSPQDALVIMMMLVVSFLLV